MTTGTVTRLARMMMIIMVVVMVADTTRSHWSAPTTTSMPNWRLADRPQVRSAEQSLPSRPICAIRLSVSRCHQWNPFQKYQYSVTWLLFFWFLLHFWCVIPLPVSGGRSSLLAENRTCNREAWFDSTASKQVVKLLSIQTNLVSVACQVQAVRLGTSH